MSALSGGNTSGGQGSNGEESAIRRRVTQSLFTVIAKINSEPGVARSFATLLVLVDAFQMMWFSVNPGPYMPFPRQELGQQILKVLQAVYFIPSYGKGSSDPHVTDGYFAAMGLWLFAVAASLLPILLLSYATWTWFQMDDFAGGVKVYRPEYPYPLLRFGARLIQPLFIPVFISLLSVFSCDTVSGSTWMNSGLACWSGVHPVLAAFSAVLIPCFLAYCLLIAACAVNRIPDEKRNIMSMAHGRVDVVMILVKSILSTAYIFGLPSGKYTVLLLIAALVGGGGVWMVGYARYQPYHQPWLNELKCALAGVYIAGCISSLLSVGIEKDAYSIGAWVFLFTAPLAAPLGWAFAAFTHSSATKKTELSSPYAVELRARAMVAELLNAEETMGSAMGHARGGGRGGGAGGTHGGSGGHGGPEQSQAEIDFLNGGGVAARGQVTGYAGVVIDERTAKLRDIQLLYDDASSVYGGSAILDIFSATFLGLVQKNRHLELLHLRAAESKLETSSVDLKFFVWERIWNIERAEAKSNTVKTSVARRLLFDTLQNQSVELSLYARTLIVDYWTEAAEISPDMARMQQLGTDILSTIRRAENVYTQLQEIAPQSTAVMRSYADFLLDISNNPKKAFELLQTAELQEEEESKAHSIGDSESQDYPFLSHTPEFDMSNENVSLLRISGEPGKLGIIQDVNPAALKMLGYGRREMLGKNIDVIVPNPLCIIHQKFLEKYMATGSETVVNTSRVYFAVHKQGYLLPVSGNIRPMEEGFGSVMEEVVTSQAYLFFHGTHGKWKVTAACKNAMAHLSITPSLIADGAVTMDRILPALTQLNDNASNKNGDNNVNVRGILGDDDADDDWVQGAGGGGREKRRGPLHSRLMNELLGASNVSGSGLDVNLNVYTWNEMAIELLRTARRLKNNNSHAASSGGQQHRSNHQTNGRSPAGDATMLHDASASGQGVFAPIRTVYALAKLQECIIPFISGPVYVLRFRINKNGGANDFTMESMLRSSAKKHKKKNYDSDDDEDNGDARSDVEPDDEDGDFGSDRGVDSDDGQEDDDEEERGRGRARFGRPGTPPKKGKTTKKSSSSAPKYTLSAALKSSSKAADHPIHFESAAGTALLGDVTTVISTAAPDTDPGITDADSAVVSDAISQAQEEITVLPGAIVDENQSSSTSEVAASVTTSLASPSKTAKKGAVATPGNRLGSAIGGARRSSSSGPVPPGSAGAATRPTTAMVTAKTPAKKGVVTKKTTTIATTTTSSSSSTPAPPATSVSSDSNVGDAKPQEQLQELQEDENNTIALAVPAPIHVPSAAIADATSDILSPKSASVVASSILSSSLSKKGSKHKKKKASKGLTWHDSAVEVDEHTRADGSPRVPMPKDLPHNHSARDIDVDNKNNNSNKNHDKSRNADGNNSRASPAPPDARQRAGSEDGGNKRAASVSSGSSAGSSVVEHLRKGIETRSRGMESSLINLRRSLTLLFVIVGSMNIASAILSNVLFTRLSYNLHIVSDNGDRGFLLQQVYSEVQRLRMMSDNVLQTYDNATSTLSLMSTAVTRLDEIHQSLYSRVDESVEAERAIYVVPSVEIRDLIPGTYTSISNYQTENRTVNLGNAGLEYLAKVRGILKRPYYENTMNESSGAVFWVLHNAPTSIRSAFNQSMIIAQDKTAGQGETILLANDVVVGLAICLLFSVTVGIMVPAVRGVVKDKAAIFEVFLNTPLGIVRSIRASSETKLNAIRRAAEEADAGLDLAGAGDSQALLDDEGLGGRNNPNNYYGGMSVGRVGNLPPGSGQSKTFTTESGGSDLMGGDPDSNVARVTAATMENSANAKRKPPKKRHFKRAAHVSSRYLLMFASPIIVLCVYYAGTWAWKRGIAQTADSAKAEVFYAHQMQFFIGQSNFNVRNTLTYCDPDFVEDQVKRFHVLTATMESVQDALLYGSASRNTRPLLKISSSMFHLMMENGCLTNSELYDYASCMGQGLTPFFDGLVGKGVQGAYKQYLQLARKTVEARYEASRPAAILPCQVQDVSAGVPLQLEHLAEKYIGAGFSRSADIVREETDAFLSRFIATDIAVTAASIIGLFIFYFAVYTPLIREMDREIKNVRYLLLLFPDDVSRQVPAIIEAGKALAHDGSMHR